VSKGEETYSGIYQMDQLNTDEAEWLMVGIQ